jgi:tetratricopeptide (TPR) repeat protein
MTRLLVLVAVGASIVRAATLEGTVQDANHRPVAAVMVHLESKNVKTDSAGKFRFDALPAGSYKIIVDGKNFGPFMLGENDVKNVDVALTADAPTFSDEPNFVVAGVTAGAYQGGHGSDVILRSREGLAKETAGLGGVSEKSGDALGTVREYQRTAQLDPSERNLFDWGAELLKHRADQAAIEVFTKGRRLFPGSSRMLLGLAVAEYSLGSYDLATHSFFAACDLDPNDPTPYLFLGKVQATEITKSAGFLDRMARFAKLNPSNALANFHYAAAMWGQRTGPEDRETPVKVKALLEKAIRIDPKLARAYLLSGAVEFDSGKVPAAIAAFQKAIEVNPDLEEAHYRLAQAYRRTAESANAQTELAVYDRLSKKSAEEAQHDRSELQQFVITLRTQ